MNWLNPEMMAGMAGIFTAIGISLKNLMEARKLAVEVHAISHQVHNNGGSSIKDSTDRIKGIERDVGELKEVTSGVVHSMDTLDMLVRSSLKAQEQLREDLATQNRQILRIDNESHESHSRIYRRLDGLEKEKKEERRNGE